MRRDLETNEYKWEDSGLQNDLWSYGQPDYTWPDLNCVALIFDEPMTAANIETSYYSGKQRGLCIRRYDWNIWIWFVELLQAEKRFLEARKSFLSLIQEKNNGALNL